VLVCISSRRGLEEDIRQLEKVMDYTKGSCLIIAVASNARSKMWHDTITNQRGKPLEEILICNDLYVLNEATETPTFQSNRGSSCIDLTIANSGLGRHVSDWICGEEESCSDYNIVNVKTASVHNGNGKTNYMGVRYITNREHYKTFDTNLATNFISTFNCINKTDANKLDEELQGKVKQHNTEDLTHDCFSCVTAACNTAFRISKGRKLKTRRTVSMVERRIKNITEKSQRSTTTSTNSKQRRS